MSTKLKSTPRVRREAPLRPRSVTTGREPKPQHPDNHEPHPLDLIRKHELAERLRINRWTLMRWCKEGRFPKPIRLSDVVLAWRVADVDRWLQERAQKAAS